MFYDVYLKLCKERGEKPYSIPKKLGWSSNSIVKQWAKGSTPREDKLNQLAEYFNVSVLYLLTGDEALRQKEKPATEVTGEDVYKIGAQMLTEFSPEEARDIINYMEWKRSQKGS